MATVNDFFNSKNLIQDCEHLDYDSLAPLIEVADTFARSTYQSIYVIDYYLRNFLYVSPNPLFLCGKTAEEVKSMGYNFYLENVPEEEVKMLLEINEAGFSFFNKRTEEEKRKMLISYDFDILRDKKKMLINHKLTPLKLTPDGQMWLALCVVSISPHKEIGYVEMRQMDSRKLWKYDLDCHKWEEASIAKLTPMETEVLRLSAQGLTMNEIADKSCKSVDTIKFYKRNIFEKFGVSNITEAINFAVSYKLI
jgi:DNA-binding CsgD family transcriptional regulator